MTDEEILSLILKEDDIGLKMLAEKYEKLLIYIATGILGSHGRDIEECVNDTYLKFWKNAKNYDYKKASLVTYLKIIVRNTAINRLRDLKRVQDPIYTQDISDISQEFMDHSQNIELIMEQKETMRRLNKVIAGFSKIDRELMIRRYFYLQSSKEISHKMHMSVTAVDSRLSRLRTRVKRECERY